jgi:hypothetical protein
MTSIPTLPSALNVVYGVTAVLLEKPTGKSGLILRATKGSFNVRTGDRVSAGMPAAFAPGAAVTDGSGAWPLAEGDTIEITPAPSAVTVRGYASTDALTYAWI